HHDRRMSVPAIDSSEPRELGFNRLCVRNVGGRSNSSGVEYSQHEFRSDAGRQDLDFDLFCAGTRRRTRLADERGGVNIMIYLDNAATSHPKPETVYQAVDHVLRNVSANPGRSGHRMAAEADRIIFEARESIAKLFGIEHPDRII